METAITTYSDLWAGIFCFICLVIMAGLKIGTVRVFRKFVWRR